jgi:molybdopterin/thiamine biosynthesis adenylyltransferase
VGTLTIVDDDDVDLTNLQRQILHTTANVGRPKVESASEGMLRINPDIDIRMVPMRVGDAELDGLVPQADVVLDCCDNFATRHAVNRACLRTASRWYPAPRCASTARSAYSTCAIPMRRATPACSRHPNRRLRPPAPRWAYSRRWSA